MSGASVNEALALYDAIIDKLHAKIYINVVNYSKWPLSSPNHKFKHGRSTLDVQIVHSGYEEAWYAEQQEFDGEGVEVMSSWSTSPNEILLTYFYIHQNTPGRPSNALAVGLTTLNHSLDLTDPFAFIETVKSSANQRADNVVYKEYSRDLHPAQSCDQIICVQLTMTAYYDAKVTLSVYPRNVTNLDSHFEGGLNQEDLDKILNEKAHCILGCEDGVKVSDAPIVLYNWQISFFILLLSHMCF